MADTERMEEQPSGSELHLWHPSGALKSRCRPAGQLLPSLHFLPLLAAQRGLHESKEPPPHPSPSMACILIQAGTMVRTAGMKKRRRRRKAGRRIKSRHSNSRNVSRNLLKFQPQLQSLHPFPLLEQQTASIRTINKTESLEA